MNVQICTFACCEYQIGTVSWSLPDEGLRHTIVVLAITELAESQANDQTIMAIAGQVSSKMVAHYSHDRLRAKRTALHNLAGQRGMGSNVYAEQASNVTNCVTNSTNPQKAAPYSIEKNGRPVRTRTGDLYRVKVAL